MSTDLSDLELARIIDTGTAAERESARTEASRRYGPLCTKLALVNCSSLAHRRRPCAGHLDEAVEHAFPVLVSYYLSRVTGRDPSPNVRPLKSLLVQWAAGPHIRSFSLYLQGGKAGKGPGGMEEALRVWNGARGLGVRMRPEGVHGLGPAYVTMIGAQPRLGQIADRLGLASEHGVVDLVRALWWDACQPRLGSDIDVERVARHLTRLGTVSMTEAEHLRPLASAVDTLVAAIDPGWYDKWLGRPRVATTYSEGWE